MTIDHGRSASPSGHSQAKPEEVSALRASVPNAVALLFDASDLCERSDSADRGLDAMIAKALMLPHGRKGGWCNSDNGDYWVVDECAAPFTASLNAALTLVPDGWAWMTGCDVDEPFFATLAPTDESGITADDVETKAATSALALCAAALRAHAASAIEARRAATTGAVHESAIGAAETPDTGRGTSHG